MEFARIENGQMAALWVGTILSFVAPLVLAIAWIKKTKEKKRKVLFGALAFFFFVIFMEKPIQNVLLFPSAMNLPEHAASQFISARPILWAFLVGLFPGVFEETGRLVIFKTALKEYKNRETSISYGIGHGGFEVMFILGMTYVSYLVYAYMINSGEFGNMIEQVRAVAPDQVEQGYAIAEQLASFSVGDLLINIVERVFAVLYHIGASILVFYASKDKKKFMLYPLAIALHTLLDGLVGLNLAGVLTISPWAMEAITAIVGYGTLYGAYFLLYKKDTAAEAKEVAV
ncbi:MAG: YhfC family intramembrane metalloprotease [Lachnospiraceae bacterium]|nr:YhfC family intramembrane metalloprotease [Lachnospiraceae bacterium]